MFSFDHQSHEPAVCPLGVMEGLLLTFIICIAWVILADLLSTSFLLLDHGGNSGYHQYPDC